MIRPEQHLQTPHLPIRLPSLLSRLEPGLEPGRTKPGLEPGRTRHDLAYEPELFGTVGDGIEVEFTEVVTGVVFETVGDDGVVVYAGCEAGGEGRESSAGVCEEDDEGRVFVECAGEDETGRGLIPQNEMTGQCLSLRHGLQSEKETIRRFE